MPDNGTSADVLLSDGSVASIRPLAPSDLDALRDLHDRVSDESLRLRFFAPGRHQVGSYLDHLARADSTTSTLVAELCGTLIGIVTAERASEDDSSVEEVAFLVDDSVSGRGVATLLLEHLAASARVRGVRRLVAEVLPENRRMLDVLQDAGFCVVRTLADGVVHVSLDPSATEASLTAAEGREAASEARSLGPLMHPHSVAVVGVRRDGSGVGAAVLRAIRTGGFRGRTVVVHPTAETVDGLPACRSLIELGEQIDIVVVAVPEIAVGEVVADAAAAGARTTVVLTSGFEELGEEGRDRQRHITEIARRASMRLIGPNCLGIIANDPRSPLNATFCGSVPRPGGLAVASQSGGVGIVLLHHAQRLRLGIASFVSLGNKADVSGNDLLAAWVRDATVTSAALYLESIGNARKFFRLARTFSERKPLLAVVGGRSAGGQRAGASHTAAAASSDAGITALFAQAGIIRCTGAEDMAETALLLAEQPLPSGPRLAVLSNAGGLGVLGADAADANGLAVPSLPAAVAGRLSDHVHGNLGITNPVDVGAGAAPADFAEAARVLLEADDVDALLVVLVATAVTDAPEILSALGRVRGARPDKPMVVVPFGEILLPTDGAPGLTCLPTIDAAVRSLGRAARYHAWRRVPRTAVRPTPEHVVRAARDTARDLMAEQGPGFVDPDSSARLLKLYGVEPVGRTARGAEELSRVVADTAAPVVVKVADPRVVHKTDRGLVKVGLTSPDEAVAAASEFARILGVATLPVLVQPALDGVEIALGLVRDPVFGPLVMVAAGGVTTDVLDDRVFLLPPITPRDAVRAVRSLRVWPLLIGLRNRPAADVNALERLILHVGRLAADVPEVAELDLNPVLTGPSGAFVVDVKLRLAPSAEAREPLLRALRPAT